MHTGWGPRSGRRKGFAGFVQGWEELGKRKSSLGKTVNEVSDHKTILFLCDLLNEPDYSCRRLVSGGEDIEWSG